MTFRELLALVTAYRALPPGPARDRVRELVPEIEELTNGLVVPVPYDWEKPDDDFAFRPKRRNDAR